MFEDKSLILNKKPNYQKQEKCEKKGFLRKVKNYLSGDSLLGATFNLSNATIGAGVLFLPFVIREMGVVFGFIALSLGGFLGSFTLYLLHKSYYFVCEKDPSVKDYEEIGYLLYGRWLSFFIQFCVFVLCFGCTITYTSVVSDLLRGWVPHNPYIHALILFLLMTPFVICSMSPKIASLRFLSYFALTAIVVFIVLVAVGYFLGFTDKLKSGSVVYFPDLSRMESWINFFSILGIVSFSYCCHPNLCPISSEFKPENRYKVGIAIFFSIVIDFILFGTIAEFGYLSFCENTQSDIILSYTGEGSWLVNALRIILSLMMCATYPMACYVGRYTFSNMIVDTLKCTCSCFCNSKNENNGKKKDCFFCCKLLENIALNVSITLGMFFVSFLFAIFYPHAADIFGIVGSTAALCCQYVFPCIFYLKLCKLSWFHPLRWCIVLVLVFGIVVGVWVTVTNLIKMIDGEY